MEAYQKLEAELGQWAGYPAENVVACNSGTSALHLAIEAFRLPAGSEVIVPDFTMIACPRTVSLAGLVPVFVDCGEDLLLDTDLAERWAGGSIGYDGKTKVIMPVHIYGRRCNMDEVSRVARLCWLKVIEDLAEAHGVRPHPATDAACWSFYRNKIVAGEEGGAVAFRDPAHAALARELRSLGFTASHDFQHTPRGHNYRLANLQAKWILNDIEGAFNWSALEYFEANIKERRRIERWYDAFCPPAWKMPPRDVVWCYDVRIPGLIWERQTTIVRTLNEAGIAARHSFKPMHTQEEYKGCRVVGGENALKASHEVLYLPANPGITEADCRRAFDLITKAVP